MGLFKVIVYFPNGKSTMTGESISEYCFIFWEPLQIQVIEPRLYVEYPLLSLVLQIPSEKV